MPVETVGGQAELTSIRTLVERAEGGALALVLEGEAGIGKSTLWQAGVEVARERGYRVLSSRPAEAERGLAHAGLGDLLENVLDSVLPVLPTPRRRALEVALLVEEDAQGLDPRTLGVAVRSALEVLAAEGPVVLAIDDVQWLDPSSANALAFALRRLDEQAILVLLTRRRGESAEPKLEQALPAGRVERVHVGPLSLGAIHQLLRARLGLALPRATLLRVHDASGGNPFYALELVRALDAEVDAARLLRVPESLEGLVRARLEELPATTRESLLLAAAVGRPSTELLASLGVDEEALGFAFENRVLERDDATIRFAHPLLASAVYYGASADARRRAHGRLADVVADPLDRARHLALSTESSEPGVAGVLEEASALASSRGASLAASELAEHALRLTPADAGEDRHRRAVVAARAHRSAGEWTRARSLLGDLLVETHSGARRAETLVLLAELESARGSIPLLEEALGEAASSPALQSVIHCRLAWASSQARIRSRASSVGARGEGRRRRAARTGTGHASHARLVRGRR